MFVIVLGSRVCIALPFAIQKEAASFSSPRVYEKRNVI